MWGSAVIGGAEWRGKQAVRCLEFIGVIGELEDFEGD